jgi:hypothetical protein
MRPDSFKGFSVGVNKPDDLGGQPIRRINPFGLGFDVNTGQLQILDLGRDLRTDLARKVLELISRPARLQLLLELLTR